jgi:hypothetical protein
MTSAQDWGKVGLAALLALALCAGSGHGGGAGVPGQEQADHHPGAVRRGRRDRRDRPADGAGPGEGARRLGPGREQAGAASQLALTELTRATPDGYTLSYAVLPTVTTHYLDPTRAAVYTRASFQPIGMHHLTWMMLAVQTESPHKTLKELVEAARAKPESIRISDSGLMAVPHTQVVMLELVTGVRFASVHFNGGAPVRHRPPRRARGGPGRLDRGLRSRRRRRASSACSAWPRSSRIPRCPTCRR